MTFSKRFFLCLALAALTLPAYAQTPAFQLPSIISDNMVLQQQRSDALWGWEAPGTTVTVTFRGDTETAKAGDDGKWMVQMPAGVAGGPFPLTVKGTTSVTLNNVLVGEVWVAGGQSNMWWHVSVSADAPKEIAAANYPNIRYWDANTSSNQGGYSTDTPQKTVLAQWKLTSPQDVGDYAGVPYFFARDLYERLKVPIGIVHISVPGTEIEQHLSPAFLQANMPQTMEVYKLHQKFDPELQKQYETDHAAWAVNKTGPEPKAPDALNIPGGLYNGMIAPTAPYTTRGFLWWQGEYNASRSLQYRVLFPGLINEWRQLWNEEDAPFLFVELANFGPVQSQPVEDAFWPDLRDAQHAALELPNTYEVSAIDVKTQAEGDWAIHPIHKQIVGHRLFLAAMANVYGDKTQEWSGPVFRSVIFKGNKAIVTFDHLHMTEQVKKNVPTTGFALAGSDHQFHWANASLLRSSPLGNQIALTSPEVPNPVAVRYDFANNPNGNLYQDGLPAFPFRTDTWNVPGK